MQEVIRDPLIVPLACRILTPTGLVDLQHRLPKRGGVSLKEVTAEEVQSYADKAGVVIKDPSACPVPVEGEEEEEGQASPPPAPPGHLLTIRTENGVDYALLRHIRALRVGQAVSVTESYSDRYSLRLWTNAVVTEPPDTSNFVAHARGSEFYNLSLTLLIVGGTT